MLILFVEDDKTIASGLAYSLEQEGYDTIVRYDVQTARAMISTRLNEITLCLFDLSLPDGSGYDLCRLIKGQSDIPVVFLTAVDDEGNVVMGLDMGADDYITKPFRIRELMSRIKSVLRRYDKSTTVHNTLLLGSVQINTAEATVFKYGDEITLTALEYRLLLTFANHPNQVLSREQLLEVGS